jgi:hypothetical protein
MLLERHAAGGQLYEGANRPLGLRGLWQPAVGFLRRHLSPSYRVEAVDTVGHREAVYLPEAGIPFVRGWFRQDTSRRTISSTRRRALAAGYVVFLRRDVAGE